VILLEELNRCEYELGERDDFRHREAKHRSKRARYMRAYRLRKRRERIEAGEEHLNSIPQFRAAVACSLPRTSAGASGPVAALTSWTRRLTCPRRGSWTSRTLERAPPPVGLPAVGRGSPGVGCGSR
jgi:hypothetical protein